jgi:hypothetical protein
LPIIGLIVPEVNTQLPSFELYVKVNNVDGVSPVILCLLSLLRAFVFLLFKQLLTIETLQELDALYEEREDMGALGGRPTRWGILVGELREIRHLVEAGVKVNV